MLKTVCYLVLASLLICEQMQAYTYKKELDYEIQNIEILQMQKSQPIALNNEGQILGWYKSKALDAQKRFFVRDKEGIHELPDNEKAGEVNIDWKFLTNKGQVYGTFNGNVGYAVLYLWDRQNGVVNLGNLPGKDIMAINDAGQVLIKSIEECDNGTCTKHPVVWDNGNVIKLNGLMGDLGYISEETYGVDMNNQGEVVGQSLVTGVNRNDVYQQVHAVKWSNGQIIDLHKNAHTTGASFALAINDNGDILIGRDYPYDHGKRCILKKDGRVLNILQNEMNKINNSGKAYGEKSIVDEAVSPPEFYATLFTYHLNEHPNDTNYFRLDKIVKVNDKNEILALSRTRNYQDHILFLRPKNSPK